MENGTISSYDITIHILNLILQDVESNERYKLVTRVCRLWHKLTGHYQFNRFYLQENRKYNINLFNHTDLSVADSNAICWASFHGRVDMVRLFLQDERVDPFKRHNTVFYSIEKGHTEIVKLLLEDKRFDSFERKDKMFEIAARNGQIDILELLLKDQRVDPSANNNDALMTAVSFGHEWTTKILLSDTRVASSARYNELIHRASNRLHGEIVELLLAFSVDHMQ